MLYQIVFICLVLSAGAESCDTKTHYMKDGLCCKMCEPGKRMSQIGTCDDPVCEECEVGEYQDSFNYMPNCKRQPSCDKNLNLEKQPQSKTEYTPCRCVPEHHCAGLDCVSCVRNKVCKAGERISVHSTQMSDTECKPCPTGSFSNQESAEMCKPWTECSAGFIEVTSGSSTSDRICETNKKLYIIPPLIVAVLLAVLALIYYRKGKSGSVSFKQKLQDCIKNTHPTARDNVYVENGPEQEQQQEQQQPRNQPQEDNENLPNVEQSLIPGISENGMPVIQDHSKSFLLSEAETEPESVLVRF